MTFVCPVCDWHGGQGDPVRAPQFCISCGYDDHMPVAPQLARYQATNRDWLLTRQPSQA